MPDHDNGYKLLFSHAELVADLIPRNDGSPGGQVDA